MKRKPKKRMIYDHWDMFSGEMWEEAKQYLVDSGEKDPTDDRIWDVLYYYDEDAFDLASEELSEVFDNGNTFLAVGTVGLWYGNFPGGFVFHNLRELFDHFSGDELTIWDENGNFFLKGSNHDGSSTVGIRQLTPKGERYYENWEWSGPEDKRTERECHKRLFFDSHYSHKIDFAHKVYGCPKIEYEREEN